MPNGITGWICRTYWVESSGPLLKLKLFSNGRLIMLLIQTRVSDGGSGYLAAVPRRGTFRGVG